MAGDWIPMRHDLFEDPSVIGLAEKLGEKTATIVGFLQKIWSFFDAQTVDGVANFVTEKWLDDLVKKKGMARGMCEVGWLEIDANSITVPNFANWMGYSAKTRLKETRKKQRQRLSPLVSRICPDFVPTLSPIEGDKKGTTGQDRTGHNNTAAGAAAQISAIEKTGCSPAIAKKLACEAVDLALIPVAVDYFTAKKSEFKSPMAALRSMLTSPEKWQFVKGDQGWEPPEAQTVSPTEMKYQQCKQRREARTRELGR